MRRTRGKLDVWPNPGGCCVQWSLWPSGLLMDSLSLQPTLTSCGSVCYLAPISWHQSIAAAANTTYKGLDNTRLFPCRLGCFLVVPLSPPPENGASPGPVTGEDGRCWWRAWANGNLVPPARSLVPSVTLRGLETVMALGRGLEGREETPFLGSWHPA